MKYVVICYAIHRKEVASYAVFDNEDAAFEFLQKDAECTYDEELNSSNEESKNNVELFLDHGVARLDSQHGDFIWTWEVIVLQ